MAAPDAGPSIFGVTQRPVFRAVLSKVNEPKGCRLIWKGHCQDPVAGLAELVSHADPPPAGRKGGSGRTGLVPTVDQADIRGLGTA